MQDSKMPSDKVIWIIVGVVALIAVLIVVGVVAGGQKKTPAASSSTTTTDTAETTSQPVSKPAESTMGQAVKCGNLSITAVSWKTSPGDEFSVPAAGNQFVIVDLDIVNNGSESEDLSTGAEMSIKTVAGYSYDIAMYFPEPKYPDGAIAAGDRARGYVAFEVPTQTTDMSFVFDPLMSDAVKIRLQ